MPEYSSQFINLKTIRRIFPGLFPLVRFGIMKNIPPNQNCILFSGKLELCFRFSTDEQVSRDVINGVHYETPFPNIFLKTPDMVHGTISEKERDAVFFAFDPNLFDRMKMHGLMEPPFLWHFQVTPEFSAALNKIIDLAGHIMEYGVADQFDLLVFQLLQDAILKRDCAAETPGSRSMENRIYGIASYLQLNFNRDFDLEDLYRKNGFSRRSFFRYWKKYFPYSPARYVQELKLEYACYQLQSTTLPVGRICEELHFQNPHYLSRLFKKRFGITPLQYRDRGEVGSGDSN